MRLILRVVALGVMLLMLAVVLTPLGRYLVRAAIAEAGILLARRPIVDVLADAEVSRATRDKLQLVEDARRFAVEVLELDAGKSFTQYSELKRDTLVLVLSAARQDFLVAHSWWFPVVGRLPYKGFFDFEKGKAEAERMAERGYDVNLRPAAAFSTLGWFNDPLLSTTLASDSVDLVDTVIHELTHNTFFAKGQAAFNESFANFVGARGASHFFRSRGDSAAADRSDAFWLDQQVLGKYWAQLFVQLDSAFRANPESREVRMQIRDSVYIAARKTLVDSLSGELQVVSTRYLETVRLDNAALLGRRVYATDLDLFEEIFRLQDGDIVATVQRVLEIARQDPDSPAAGMRSWIAARG